MPVLVEISGLDRLNQHLASMEAGLERSAKVIVRELAAQMKRALRSEAPQGTGALRHGLSYRVSGTSTNATARFFDSQSYAFFVIKGTKAHAVQPIHRLDISWPGAPHPVGFIQHPGAKANPFTSRAMDKVEHDAEAPLAAVGESIVQGEPV